MEHEYKEVSVCQLHRSKQEERYRTAANQNANPHANKTHHIIYTTNEMHLASQNAVK
jgi:hypothetical protein